MNADDFEKQVERQPMRQMPADWRAEILGAAASSVPRHAAPNTKRTSWWRELLWPCPQAWAGLAAVWVVILAINFSTRERGEIVAQKTEPPSQQEMMAMEEQKRIMAKLRGTFDEPAEQPKTFVPRPRGERRVTVVIV